MDAASRAMSYATAGVGRRFFVGRRQDGGVSTCDPDFGVGDEERPPREGRGLDDRLHASATTRSEVADVAAADSQAALTPTAPPQRVDTSRASDPATADATRWWRRPRDARLWTDLDDMKRTGGVRRGHGATDADTGPAPTPAPPTYEMTAPVTRSRRKITGSTMLS